MDKIIQRKNLYSAIIAGTTLGILVSFSPGSLFFIPLTITTVFFINRIPDKKERNFILNLFLLGFVTRIFFCLLITGLAIFTRHILNYVWLGCPNYNAACVIDDSAYYTLRSQFTNMYWMDKPMSQYTTEGIVKNSYGFTGFVYILASYFTLFGYSPVSSKFINCFIGVLTAILIYSLVKEIFGVKPARVSSILTAFFPSLFLWSLTNLKETIFIFAVYLMFFAVIKLRRTKKIYYPFITLLSIWFQFFIRSSYQEFVYLTISVLSLYFFYLLILNLYNKKQNITILIIFIIAIAFIFLQKDRISSASDFLKQRALIQHRGAISEGGINYKLLPDRELNKDNISDGQFLIMLVNGWLHFFLEPFPWGIKSKPMFFSLPQMLIWYLLLIFAILGIAISLRYKSKESLCLILYFFIIASALSVTGGNIGTTFRLRDTITPIILIFASIGLVKTFNYFNLQKEIRGVT